MSILSGTLGAVMGANAQDDATAAQERSAQEANATQRYMYDQSRRDMQGYMDAGGRALRSLEPSVDSYVDDPYRTQRRESGIAGEEQALTSAGVSRDQAGQLSLANLAQLVNERNSAPGRFNYQTDPGFQFMQNQQNRVLNQQLAGRGKYFSGRAVDETLGNANQRLIASEYDKLYGRNIAEADSRFTRGANLAGARLGEADTTYGRALDAYGRRAGEINQKYNLSLADLLRYQDNKWNFIKAGQGAAGSIGSLGANSANAQSNTLAQLGQNAMAAGANRAQLWSGLGGASANTIGAGLRIYDYGKNAGWWGGSNAGAGYTAGAVGTGYGYATNPEATESIYSAAMYA